MCKQTDVRMIQLAKSFPTLRNAPGVEPWEPAALEAWATSSAPSTGARHAARFVLAVWNDRAPWACGHFNLHAALGVWDAEHRHALQKWLAAPWCP